jgi:hypothetical protein
MKLKDATDALDDFTKRTSENVRFLGLAGLGFLWVLSGQKFPLPRDVLIAVLLLVVVLVLDFLQYVVGARIWDGFVAEQEAKGKTREDPVQAPREIHRPIYLLYRMKIGALVLAYLALGYAIVKRLVA